MGKKKKQKSQERKDPIYSISELELIALMELTLFKSLYSSADSENNWDYSEFNLPGVLKEFLEINNIVGL